MTIEVRLRRMGQEILTAAGVGAGERHSESAALVPMAIHLVTNCVSRTTIAVAARIAVLDHEIRNDTMEARIAVVARLGEREEIADGDRRFGAEELETKIAAHRVNRRA